MSVVLMLEMPGMTPEVYEAINERIGFPGSAPEGLLAHIAAVEEAGMRVADVWESEQQFERFLQDELLPAMGEIDTEASISPPRVVQLQLHDQWSSS
jgi:hypothetical protein